jgi:hypothetical protein
MRNFTANIVRLYRGRSDWINIKRGPVQRVRAVKYALGPLQKGVADSDGSTMHSVAQ